LSCLVVDRKVCYKKIGASLSINYYPLPPITFLLENLIPLQLLKEVAIFGAKLSGTALVPTLDSTDLKPLNLLF
jgi:hypothetical protein